MNRAFLMGRLTRDPEVRYTNTGKCVTQFTVAIDRQFGNPQNGQKQADFIPVVTWDKTAELCGNSLAKGHRVLVEGRIQTRSYDAKDGTKRYVTEVVADRVEFVERKADSANRGAAQQGYGAPQGGQYGGGAAAAPYGNAPQGGDVDAFGDPLPDETVPF